MGICPQFGLDEGPRSLNAVAVLCFTCQQPLYTVLHLHAGEIDVSSRLLLSPRVIGRIRSGAVLRWGRGGATAPSQTSALLNILVAEQIRTVET